MQRLEHAGRVVGEHLGAPRVGGQRRDLVGGEPVGGADPEAGGRSGVVLAPRAPCADLGDLARSDENDVAGAHLKPLRRGAGAQLGVVDGLSGLEPVHAAVARDVEQDAAADHAVGDAVDAVDRRSGAGDVLEAVAVVHLAPVEDVGQRIPLRAALQRHGDGVVGVAEDREVVLCAQRDVATVLEHGVHGVGPAAEPPALGAVAVERQAARHDAPRTDHGGRVGQRLRGDEVEGPSLVFGAPPPPVAVAEAELVDQRDRLFLRGGQQRRGGKDRGVGVRHAGTLSVNGAVLGEC